VGLGRSFQYFISGPGSSNVSVYIYNLNRSYIPDGIDSEILRSENQAATLDVLRTRPGAKIIDVHPGIDGGKIGFRATTFQLEHQGLPMYSFLLMAAKNNLFIKIRATLVRDGELKNNLEVVADFLFRLSVLLNNKVAS
jgi:hypothetical protein